ncbi:hypothetical protein NQZ68_009393 [Dissostichus eleginoides]|nr:hypothetical protein NQZ68_009393 [Dissostichus eleginoides]
MNVTSFYASSRKKRVELAQPVDVSQDELEISSDEDELQAHLQGENERDENYEPENEDENEDQDEDQDEDEEKDEDQDEDSKGESAVTDHSPKENNPLCWNSKAQRLAGCSFSDDKVMKKKGKGTFEEKATSYGRSPTQGSEMA